MTRPFPLNIATGEGGSFPVFSQHFPVFFSNIKVHDCSSKFYNTILDKLEIWEKPVPFFAYKMLTDPLEEFSKMDLLEGYSI